MIENSQNFPPQENKLKSVFIHSGRSHRKPSLNKSGTVKVDLSRTDLTDPFLSELLISSNITSISMEKCNLTVFPEIICKLPSVRQISLKSNKIVHLPSTISQMTHLETFSMEDNLLSAIPESFISAFPRLSKFVVKNNRLQQLSCQFPTSLRHLDLSYNTLELFPTNITDLCSLENLSLQGNKIGDSVPENLGDMVNLQSLNLGKCELSSFPEALGSLKRLNRLNLSGNKISNVPPSILRLKNLKILNISSNRICQINENICFCVSLEELNLSNNAVEDLPIEIAALKNLKKLNISKNMFKNVHYSISAMENLVHVVISHNSLNSIGNPLARISHLTFLNLSGVDLRQLSIELTSFVSLMEIVLDDCNLDNLEFMNSVNFSRKLEKLQAGNNSIKSLPANISQYSTLKCLLLPDNRLQDLPLLENLVEVNLTNNLFKEFPASLTSCKKLNKLIFTQENGHKISDFSVNDDSFENLTELNLSHNDISFLPESPKWIANMQSLIINNNKLIELPSYIVTATKLLTLEASNNKLTTLPLQMWKLTRLTCLDLKGNNLKSPPMEFVQEFDIQTVFEHLKVLNDRADCLFDNFARIIASSMTWKHFKSFVPKIRLSEDQREKYNSIGRKDPGLQNSIFEAMIDYKGTLKAEDVRAETLMQLMNRNGYKEIFSVMKNKLTEYSLFTC